ncbi:hypothetical protein AB0O01_01550 [Streptomyces sp. NPDC093252]|uniref:hypothetical protein n=1 Tax=Streptomyces sp. NPDC093252 TaxID=3154980 RepID=UPI0034455363
MADRHSRTYDLTGFTAENYRPTTRLATAAAYSFPHLGEKQTRPARPGKGTGELLQSAMMFGGIDVMPFTIRDRTLAVVACRGNETVGISIIDPTGDTARDAVTWTEPTQEPWVAHALKIVLLRNARAAGIDRVTVQGGTPTEAIYEALGLDSTETAA